MTLLHFSSHHARRSHFGLALWMLVVTASCASSSVIVSPGFQDVTGGGATLVVVPLTVALGNADDVRDDLGPGHADRTYLHYLNLTLVDALSRHTHFTSVVMDTTWATVDTSGIVSLFGNPVRGRSGATTAALPPELRSRELKIGKKKEMFHLPVDGSRLAGLSSRGDFVLFLDSVAVWRMMDRGTYQAPSATEYLVHDVKFAFWDNRSGQIVAYGVIRSQQLVILGMNQNTWKKGVEGIAKRVAEKTVFSRPAPASDETKGSG